MKYFIDTEFIERFHKPLFGKARHVIDLISIGIVDEDGREYYAISNEYRYKDASEWVQKNVIIPMYTQEVSGDARNYLRADNFHKHILKGKSLKQISYEVMHFCKPYMLLPNLGNMPKYDDIEFYGYFADYDWVVFCSLFGTMMDLPNGFPMYCNDLKQTLDERANAITQLEMTTHLFSSDNWTTVAPISKSIHNIDDYTLEMKIELLKADNNYPKQENEHNALADAKWNYELYKFLQTL